MINGENKGKKRGIQCNLKKSLIVQALEICLYSLPVKPSPNSTNDQSINLMLACLFEVPKCERGRGTENHSQLYGPLTLYCKVTLVLHQNQIWEHEPAI
jgi:hypothetical protein